MIVRALWFAERLATRVHTPHARPHIPTYTHIHKHATYTHTHYHTQPHVQSCINHTPHTVQYTSTSDTFTHTHTYTNTQTWPVSVRGMWAWLSDTVLVCACDMCLICFFAGMQWMHRPVCVRGYMGARMGCVYTSGEPFGKPQCTASTLFCQTYILARINVPRLIARSPRRTHTGRCIHCIPAKKQMRHMSQAHTQARCQITTPTCP